MKTHLKNTVGKISLLAMFLPFLACSSPVKSDNSDQDSDSTDTPSITYHERALAVYDNIRKYYYVNEHDLFKENYPRRSGDREVSYLWPYFGTVAGVNTLLKIGYEFEGLYNVVDGFDKYYDDSHDPVAYSAYPPSLGNSDHFYDDNAVTGLKLLNAFKITGDSQYLQKAEQIMPFLYTGEVDECGGGIAWKENYVTNPDNPDAIIGMSSSGYSALLALKLYQATGKQEYFDFGKRVYRWLKGNLKNSARNIYWNDVKFSDCSVNKDLYTYNTGVMMRVEIALYEITEEERHLQEAKDLGQGAFNVFTSYYQGKPFFPRSDPWFNVKLFQGYLDLYKHDESAEEYINVFIENANYAWENARNQDGLFYADWTGQNKTGDKWLLNQASLVEIYGRISLFKGEVLN